MTVNCGCCHVYAKIYSLCLNSFLTSRRIEIDTLLSRFCLFVFLSFDTGWQEDVTWAFLWIGTPIEWASSRSPLLNFLIHPLLLKQKLVTFSPNEIKNLESLTIHCQNFQIHRPISQSTFMVPRLPMEPPPWFHHFFRRLFHAYFIPCSSEVIFVFFDENLSTFLTSKPLKCFEILKSWRQQWQF